MSVVRASLDDKYTSYGGYVYLTGMQTLARALMLQSQTDRMRGLRTRGFVSGYPGSPLAGLDLTLDSARGHLEKAGVVVQAGLNEDLAASAIWGTQQLHLAPGATCDGVFSMWYAKGPGLDRSGDALIHANAAGTSAHGGVLLVVGDDHAARTTTTPHQCEFLLAAASVPVLYPATLQDYVDLSLHGWALSRYSGLWAALKTVCDTIESSGSVCIPSEMELAGRNDPRLRSSGHNIRWPDAPLEQERRLRGERIPAVFEYVRQAALNRTVIAAPERKLGIVCAGKSYVDVMEGLRLLGIDPPRAADWGISVLKLALIWPVEPRGLREFAAGHEEILVVEEKRSFIEAQVKELLYNVPAASRPRIVGKQDQEFGDPREQLLSSLGELRPSVIAKVIAHRLLKTGERDEIRSALGRLEHREARDQAARQIKIDYGTQSLMTSGRLPYFCSGCPHNSSTRLPAGSRAQAGIGCHFMVMWMDRSTTTFSHMGAEGVSWLGQAPFTSEKHIFANMGDGTYLHSGVLAIRAAVAAGVSVTYKILYNGVVAMTGGQRLSGDLSVVDLARQLLAEKVRRVVIVTSSESSGFERRSIPASVDIYDRSELDHVQRELRETPGVTVLIFDQGCASKRRQLRRRGKVAPPKALPFINPEVCEGCGDCSKESNCVAVVPLETPLGRKRAIDPSLCNTDLACLQGFCPSFVTLRGATRKPPKTPSHELADVPAPAVAADIFSRRDTYDILIAGVGGTGVMTLGAILGVAAHIDGLRVSVLDMTGLAVRGGAVLSHVRISQHDFAAHTSRIPEAADAAIGCDIAVLCEPQPFEYLEADRTRAVVNTFMSPTAQFIGSPDLRFPLAEFQQKLRGVVGESSATFLDSSQESLQLLGDSVFGNMLLLGSAYQRGLIPLSLRALQVAIELNGTQVALNLRAFEIGRGLVHSPALPQRRPGARASEQDSSATLSAALEFWRVLLTDYQNRAYAARHEALVGQVACAEGMISEEDKLARAVAQSYGKVLAYKDEYEVGRLYSRQQFRESLAGTFEGPLRIQYHLAPPTLMRLLRKRHGVSAKITVGSWFIWVFRLLSSLRFLRGTAFDLFGYTAERRNERALIVRYERLVSRLLPRITRENLALAVQIASLPLSVKGFGHIKEAAIEHMSLEEARLWEAFTATGNTPGRTTQSATP